MQCTEDYLRSGERSRRLRILCAYPRSNFQAYPPAWNPPPKAAMEAREFIHVRLHGNIDFYGKSGFRTAGEYGIRYHGLPEGADASFFLCKELIPGYLDQVTGVYATPAGYFVDEAEAEAFDRQFPPKEKLKLPGQLF